MAHLHDQTEDQSGSEYEYHPDEFAGGDPWLHALAVLMHPYSRITGKGGGKGKGSKGKTSNGSKGNDNGKGSKNNMVNRGSNGNDNGKGKILLGDSDAESSS